MSLIITTFAHGNGPFSRMVDLKIAYGNMRENAGLPRLSAVVPLMRNYTFKGKEPGSRQIQFMKETAEEAAGKGFLDKYPNEFLLDDQLGDAQEMVFFTGSNYEEALEKFLANSEKANEAWKKRIGQGRVQLKNLKGETVDVDLRDAKIEFGLNNRIATGHPNAFYLNGGAGYFHEVLHRAIGRNEVNIDNELMERAISLAEKTVDYQKLHFLSDPGVFSYDRQRRTERPTEVHTPPQMHIPTLDSTPLQEPGLFVMVTGIQGIKESDFYAIAAQMGLQIYNSFGGEEFQKKYGSIPHSGAKSMNRKFLARIARTGWSSVWETFMAAELGINMGFLYPRHDPKDDPEILMNNMGVEKLGLGVELNPDRPKQSLELALERARFNAKFNGALKTNYGTLDGIEYIAETIMLKELPESGRGAMGERRDACQRMLLRRSLEPVSPTYIRPEILSL